MHLLFQQKAQLCVVLVFFLSFSRHSCTQQSFPNASLIIGTSILRIVGSNLASQQVFQIVGAALGSLGAYEGNSFAIDSISSNCAEAAALDFQIFCSLDVAAPMTVMNATAYNAVGYRGSLRVPDSSRLADAKEFLQNEFTKAGYNLTGILLLQKNGIPAPGIDPEPVKRQFIFSLQLTGQGLLPWTVLKQTAFLLAVQKAASFSNITRYGFGNVSDSALSFPEVLAAVSPSSPQGRRRLFGTRPLPHSLGVFPQVLGGERKSVHQRVLQETTGGNDDSIDVYLRLSTEQVNLTAAEFWGLIFPSQGSNPGLITILSGFGMPLAVQYKGAVTVLRYGDGHFENGTIEGSPLLISPPASGQGTGISRSIVLVLSLCIPSLLLLSSLAALLAWRQRRKLKSLRLASSSPVAGFKPIEKKTKPFQKLQLQFTLSLPSDGGSSIDDQSPDRLSSLVGSLDNFQDIDQSEIEICKRPDGTDWSLGSGGFGQVYMAMRRGVQIVAVKQLHLCGDPDVASRQLLKEVNILRRVSCDQNIVQFFGTVWNSPRGPMLVMEFCEAGDLASNLWRPELCWEQRGHRIALGVARGLQFLHSCKIIHRDIKASNILLTKEGLAKLADVGLAKVMSKDTLSETSQGCTFAYSAPELLLGKLCTEKVDCYSLGVVLWELVAREQAVRGNLRHFSDDECAPAIATLIDDLLQVDPTRRPSPAEVVARLRAAAARPAPIDSPTANTPRGNCNN